MGGWLGVALLLLGELTLYGLRQAWLAIPEDPLLVKSRQLRKGMARQQVEALLGETDAPYHFGGALSYQETSWHSGGGSLWVRLTADGLESWQYSPEWGMPFLDRLRAWLPW